MQNESFGLLIQSESGALRLQLRCSLFVHVLELTIMVKKIKAKLRPTTFSEKAEGQPVTCEPEACDEERRAGAERASFGRLTELVLVEVIAALPAEQVRGAGQVMAMFI